jgi:hypothetical protein
MLAFALVLAVGCGKDVSTGPVTNSNSRLEIRFAGTGAGGVTSADGRMSCHTGTTVCSVTFSAPSTFVLTASPDPGSTFTGWTGGCEGTQNPYTKTIDQAGATVSCFAGFDPPVQVTVLLTGNGTGTVTSNPSGISCPGTCTAGFPGNAAVTLTAAPNPSSTFSRWTGCSTSSTPVLAITASTAITCTARFVTPVVISDDFDDAGAFARWDIALRQDAPPSSVSSESNPLTGGFPGGYRAGRYDFSVATPPALTIRVDHVLRGDASHPGTYSPSQTGLIDSLVVSMDRLVTHAPNPGAMVGSFFVLRQGANLFYAIIDPGNFFSNLTWQPIKQTLLPGDFFSSPAGTTPNFEAPMEFGFRRATTFSSSNANSFISWGTDNFRVEVWHR